MFVMIQKVDIIVQIKMPAISYFQGIIQKIWT